MKRTETFLMWLDFGIAYLKFFLDCICTLPLPIYLGSIATLFVLATSVRWNPFQAQKMVLTMNSTQISAYASFLRFTQAYGDSVLTEHIYISLLPVLRNGDQKIQEEYRDITYPQEKIFRQESFWLAVYRKQPTSREALIALSVLSYQQFKQDALEDYVARLEKIEPNDQRAIILKTYK